MLRTLSPLRYPGGKSCLYDLFSTILRENHLDRVEYIEPYAGGCGLALSLLYGGHVSDVHLNDLDCAIWAFWVSVLENSESLIKLVQNTPLTIREWRKQKDIYEEANGRKPLQLGFATFFLNRTNRSGVIKGGGVIGGLSQTGLYKLNCRFNTEDLVRRIQRVAKYRNRIHLYNCDAVPFIQKMAATLPQRAFFCIDPPYFGKGSKLYTNFYGPEEHKDVAETVMKLKQPWVVTYDDCKAIRDLYSKRRQVIFDINYLIQTKRVGTELLICSKGLRLPLGLRQQQNRSTSAA